MTSLPVWMQRAMLATAVMNLLGALAFTPWGAPIRALVQLPEGTHPLYLSIIGVFVLIFGVGYLWCGLTARADPLFVAVAAAGKLSFFGLLTAFCLGGDLTWRAPVAAVGDLVFGVLFAAWLAHAAPA